MAKRPDPTAFQSFSAHSDDTHTPLLAMWYQARTALADLTIPVLAGLKVVWLILLTPLRFFRAYMLGTKDLASLRTPFDVFWRTLTPEDRVPLDAAKFLLFGILTAALAGFGFDNTNRLSGLLSQTNALGSGLDTLAQQNAVLADALLRLRAFWQNETVQAIQAFLDRELIAAIVEMFVTLFVTMLFAYLFRVVARSKVSARGLYTFWLYMTGMQFFTTGITFLIFSIVSLPAFGLAELTPELIFLILENGLLIVWQYLLPLFVLPRIFPALTVRRTLLALLVTHGIFILADWLLRAGFTTIILFLSALTARF